MNPPRAVVEPRDEPGAGAVAGLGSALGAGRGVPGSTVSELEVDEGTGLIGSKKC
jgi:hypothetical protein